jgi:hypothetical protein
MKEFPVENMKVSSDRLVAEIQTAMREERSKANPEPMDER